MNIDTPAKIGPYQVNFKIGSGSSSTVFNGTDLRDGKAVAMKFVSRKKLADRKQFSYFERELRIAERVSHKNIVALYDTVFTQDHIILVMEHLRCGTLTAFKNYSFVKIQDNTYLRWGKEILEGLSYLHERKICHHDIKPDNIGFDDDMNAKIFDFGLCEECDLKKKNCDHSCGTPLFVAPEVMVDDVYDGDKADMWSFGVTFHFMVTGELPFADVTYEEFVSHCPNVKHLIVNKCEGVLKEIVDRSLNTDPTKRPTAKELLMSGLFKDAEQVIPIPKLTFKPLTKKPQQQQKLRLPIPQAIANRRLSKPTIFVPMRIKPCYSEKISQVFSPTGAKQKSTPF